VDFFAVASKPLQQMLAERRIYCLTPKADSTLMWSHYADNHCGVCLEFSVANNMLPRYAAEWNIANNTRIGFRATSMTRPVELPN
jgi:hypothetical protein